MVERVCGVPQDLFLKVAEALLNNSGRERTSAFCYAVAWTQHTIGTQMISGCALLQLLLGNIGRPGGGILALRGHATIQGSTDIPTLYNLLPGYLPMPSALKRHHSLDEYLKTEQPQRGWWYHTLVCATGRSPRITSRGRRRSTTRSIPTSRAARSP